MWYIAIEENINYLAHHGVKGQKWGIRRYQNEDGSLTNEGRERYGLNSLKKKQKFQGTKRQARKAYLEEEFYRNVIKSNEAEKKFREEYEKTTGKGLADPDDEYSREGQKFFRDVESMRVKAKNEVDKYLESKYGKETIESAKKRESFKNGMQAAIAISSLPIVAPLVLNPIGITVMSKSTNKEAAKTEKRHEELKKKYEG